MLKRDLIKYRVTIDEAYSEDGEVLGIDLISNVKNPAVKIKGMSFSSIENKSLRFTDDLKYRIAAPILVPDEIYRNDDSEYMLIFTSDDIETIAKKFMSTLPKKNGEVFNLEHGAEMIDSYLLEVILVDSDSKIRMIKDSYNVDVPIGTFFGVQQFNDKNKYKELVANGQTGFSIEGFLGMILVEDDNKIKMNINSKLKMMKNKKKFVGTKRVLKSASKKKLEEVIENEDLIMIADELAEGAPVVIVEDITAGPIEDFTGEIDTQNGETVIIENGVITEVVSAEMPVEPVIEDVVDEAMAEPVIEDVVVDEVMAEPVVETPAEPVAEAPADVKSELEEVYQMIAELKAEIAALKQEESTEEGGEVVMNKQKFSNTLTAFNEWMKNKN